MATEDERINAIVEARVAEALKNRMNDEAIIARNNAEQQKQNQALRQLAAAAGQEKRLESDFRNERSFDRSTSLSRAPAIQSAAGDMAGEIFAEFAGG